EPFVLAGSLAPSRGPGFVLRCGKAHRDIRDRSVFRLSCAVVHYESIARLSRLLHCFDSLCQRAYLVDLDEQCVCGPEAYTLLDSFDICDKEVVPDDLESRTELLRNFCEVVKIFVVERVLDRLHGKTPSQTSIEFEQVFAPNLLSINQVRLLILIVEAV